MHFVLEEYLQEQMELTKDDFRTFEEKDVLHPVRKNGRIYYSSRDVYRLKGILYLMRTQGMTLEAAKERMEGPMTFPAQVPTSDCRN